MIEEGESAPPFTLPGVHEEELGRFDLEEVLGDEVIVLAFYPGPFNPACTDHSADLDDLDLFTMQKDVAVFGITADSIFSNRKFYSEYDLHFPLLSDVTGEVAEQYGVARDDPDDGYLIKRAVVVINHTEDVEYTWELDDPAAEFDAEAVRDAIANIGSDETAQARYRVGHAHYIEGRRAFTSAMKSYGNKDWMLAQGDFIRASEEFDEARSEFNTAVRFSEDEERRKYFERAESKSESLWRAAEWLSESSNAFASGEGAKGDKLREDTEAPLQEAKKFHEPPDPDGFPPEEDPAGETEAEMPDGKSYLDPDDGEEVDTSLDLVEGQGDDGTDEQAPGGEQGTPPAHSTGQPTDEPHHARAEGSPPGQESVASTDTSTRNQAETGAENGSQGAEPSVSGESAGIGNIEINEDEIEEIASEILGHAGSERDTGGSDEETTGDGFITQRLGSNSASSAGNQSAGPTETAGNSASAPKNGSHEEGGASGTQRDDSRTIDSGDDLVEGEIELNLTDPTATDDEDSNDENEQSS